MTRITSTILIFMILINGTVTIMSASGLSEDIGVELAPGVSDSMNQVVQDVKNGFNPNVSIVESLISFFLAGLNVFQTIVSGLFVAPTMFINLLGGGSLVSTIVTVMFAPLYLISTLEMVYLATGRDMV